MRRTLLLAELILAAVVALLLAPIAGAQTLIPIICPQAAQEGGNRYSCEAWQAPKANPAAADLALRCEWSAAVGAPIGACGDQRWTQWSQITPDRLVLAQGDVWALRSTFGVVTPPPTPQPPPTPTWTGDMVLAWTAPALNTDGTAIAPPVSYRVTIDGVVRAAVSGLTYTATGLAAGTHCATIAAITSGGTSSETGQACRTLTEPPPTSACTAPKPADETQTAQCATPQTGTWVQTRTYSAAAYPTCWTPGAWTPAIAPTGACVTPPISPVVAAVVPGVTAAPVFGISGTNTRGTTVLGFLPIGKPCTGAVVFTYRGQSYRRFNIADAIWWQSAATTNAAVACQ